MRNVVWLTVIVLGGCGSEFSATEQPICDGKKQKGEEVTDDVFDVDGDGYVDGTNPACQEHYDPEDLDCDDFDELRNPGELEVQCDGIDNDCDDATLDGDDDDNDGWTFCDDCNDADATISPSAVEVLCNGVDDDCDPKTVDARDVDGDSSSSCDDCDDTDSSVFPGNIEDCEDDIDNDCDGIVNEECASDYSDTWSTDSYVTYSCAYGNVNIGFNQILIQDNDPVITLTSVGTGSQPGSMSGYFTTGLEWSANRIITGTCTETYTIEGEFLDENTFTATFTAQFSGGAMCLDCSNRSWTIEGTR